LKIGIFGDSFASAELKCHQDYPAYVEKQVLGKSWPELLSTDFEIKNFAVSGSDLFYSFNLYQKHKEDFDKTIFVITSPFRLQVSDGEKIYRFNNLADLEDLVDTKIKDAVFSYYRYILDEEKELYFYNYMIDTVYKDKNCIAINGFGDEGLINVFEMENKIFNTESRSSRRGNFLDFRYCHMTAENNKRLAKKLFDCIVHDIDYSFDLSYFKKPDISQKSIYIVRKDSV